MGVNEVDFEKSSEFMDGFYVTEAGMIHDWDGCEIKQFCGDSGLKKVSINGFSFFVHELVAEAFVPNPSGYENISWLDGNNQNNESGNLEWSENVFSGSKKNRMPVFEFNLKGEMIAEYPSTRQAALLTGCTESGVRNCLKGITKHCKGKLFSYKTKVDISNPISLKTTAKRQIAQWNLDGSLVKVHESLAAAAKAVNGSKSPLTKAIASGIGKAYGFLWTSGKDSEPKILAVSDVGEKVGPFIISKFLEENPDKVSSIINSIANPRHKPIGYEISLTV